MTRSVTDWAQVMARVPRECYIPDIIWRQDRGRDGNDLVPVDRRIDPAGWAALVAADEPVKTQVDYGHPGPDGAGWEVTSSCSDRRVVADMLAALDLIPGDRVLEIGTGTGWNAALLAEVGAQVTSVEIDPGIADDARARLGGSVRVVTADGEHGWSADAPYDSVIATAGAERVPVAWVEQTRVGGRLVVPLTREWYSPGIAVLTRTDTGAVGHLAGPAAFMSLRGQAAPRPRGTALAVDDVRASTTELHPYYLAQDRAPGVAIGQRVSGITWAWHSPEDSHRGRLMLYAEPSWASIDARTGPPYHVRQAGPRRLVDEVKAGYRWWHDGGEPGVERWAVHVPPTPGTDGLKPPGSPRPGTSSASSRS